MTYTMNESAIELAKSLGMVRTKRVHGEGTSWERWGYPTSQFRVEVNNVTNEAYIVKLFQTGWYPSPRTQTRKNRVTDVLRKYAAQKHPPLTSR